MLYIPHGSDERITRRSESCICQPFISHMVQMKVLSWWSAHKSERALYPTWFRWKALLRLNGLSRDEALYPTWFRWKLASWALVESINNFISHMVQMKEYTDPAHFVHTRLYIPHGSDERARVGLILDLPFFFISHMVQMKGSIYIFLCCPCWTLYPTWFRWKLSRRHACSCC